MGSRKLTKKRRESKKEPRRMSLDIPERFKDGDDAEDDVTAPKRSNTVSMNQSIFSMIARAGQQSQTDLGTMQEVDSGDSEDEGKRNMPYHSLDAAARISRLSSANDFQSSPDEPHDGKADKSKHKGTLSENKLLRSLPKLKISSKKDVKPEGQPADLMSSSQFLPPRPSPETSIGLPTSEQPSKGKTKATPGEDIHVKKTRSSDRRSKNRASAEMVKSKAPATLANKIKQIFEFDEVEDVISEYPCWLLRSILLQGYMYITQKHICFYAYIPKKHVRLHFLSS